MQYSDVVESCADTRPARRGQKHHNHKMANAAPQLILAGCVAKIEGGKKRVLLEAVTPGSPAAHRDSLRKLLSTVPAQQPGFVTKSVDRLGRRLSLIVGEATPQVTLHVLVQPPLMFLSLIHI